jgi:hypothetical protein
MTALVVLNMVNQLLLDGILVMLVGHRLSRVLQPA